MILYSMKSILGLFVMTLTLLSGWIWCHIVIDDGIHTVVLIVSIEKTLKFEMNS